MACAVYRSLLRPSDRGLAYIKFGLDERNCKHVGPELGEVERD